MNAILELRRTTSELLGEILRECAARGSRLGSELDAARALHALSFDLLGVGCAAPRLALAEAELQRLHVRELARLLGEAAALRMTELERGAGDEPEPLAVWRAALEDELRSARRDGLRTSAALRALFARCGASELAAWPDALELARAAVALRDGDRERRRLAQALRAAGHSQQASECAARSLPRATSARSLRCWLELLARTQADLGHPERAALLCASA